MSRDIIKLADLIYIKFKEDLEKEMGIEEGKRTHEAAGLGAALSSKFLNWIIDFNIDKVRKLYEKRLEIEKELMLEKYSFMPNDGIEALKERLEVIINREIDNLKTRKYVGEYEPWMDQRIEEMRNSLLNRAINDVKIERGLDNLRLNKEKREHFSPEHVESLMKIFSLRDKVNLHFKNKFGFELLKMEQEGVIPEIVRPCEIETHFAMKIALLGNLIDWMNVEDLKSNIEGEIKGAKSITLLEQFLKYKSIPYEDKSIRNLRTINDLRNKKFPIHKEGEEVIDIFREIEEKYPPDNWDIVWKKILGLYLESLEDLVKAIERC